jgi:hypothetical protein
MPVGEFRSMKTAILLHMFHVSVYVFWGLPQAVQATWSLSDEISVY